MLLGIMARGERSPDARRANELGTLVDVGSLSVYDRTRTKALIPRVAVYRVVETLSQLIRNENAMCRVPSSMGDQTTAGKPRVYL